MSLLRTQVAAARDVATRCAQRDADRSDHIAPASVARDVDLLHQAVGDHRRTGSCVRSPTVRAPGRPRLGTP